MKQPRPTPELLDALARLRNMHEFQRLVKYQQEMHEYHKHLLVTASPAEFSALQGKAQEQREFLELLQKATK